MILLVCLTSRLGYKVLLRQHILGLGSWVKYFASILCDLPGSTHFTGGPEATRG